MRIQFLLLLALVFAAMNVLAEEKEKLMPVDTAKPGTYSFEKWKYEYKISGIGTRSEKRAGTLSYDGKLVAPDAKPNDRIKTPWGVMMQKGPGIYENGWLLKLTYDRPIDEKSGKLWPSPDERERNQKV